MTLFLLNDKFVFPNPILAEPDGLLAVGGGLEPERILNAYRMGIFPWYSEGQPILWWSPDPRLILLPRQIHISKSLKRVLKSGQYEVKFDSDFQKVIEFCGRIKRHGQNGTWITSDMMEAYSRLHEQGYCHSAEVFFQGKLAGGLYGISLGKAFFGESMFSLKNNASKVALAVLAQALLKQNFDFIDCQVSSDHLKTMGAVEVERREFLERLSKALANPTNKGKWNYLNQPPYEYC